MKSIILSFLLTFLSLVINAQVGIGTTTPDNSAALDITSTNSGLLVPRIDLTSATDTATILSPATSLLVYNTALGGLSPAGYYYWNGTTWIAFTGAAGNDWTLTGNAGTNTGTNFLGTTDDVDLVFRRNNLRAGFIGNSNTASGNMNTSFGANSLVSSTGTRNVAIGTNVMPSNSTGTANVAVGERSMFSNTTGNENTALGVGALFSNIAGDSNTALGRNALTTNTADFNTAVGDRALNANADGTENTAVGNNSLLLNTGGDNNVAVGVQALRANTTGNNNTAIGYQAGNTITTGANNIMIGANAVASAATVSNQLNIGNTIFSSMAGALTAGVNTTRTIGLNVIAPQAALDIVSTNNGILIPRVALTATTTVLPVVTGRTSELVYNTATAGDVTPGFYYLSTNTGPWLRLGGGPEIDPQVSSATINQVPKWDGTTLVDGALTDTGATVGINSPTPAGALDINSTTDGMVIPRVALQGLNFAPPLTTPVTSELVYNTNDNSASPLIGILGLVTPGFYFWNGAAWERFVTGTVPTSGWQTTGNTGIVDGTNFIGTAAATNVDVAFRRNNAAAGKISGTSTSFGVGALTAGATTNGTAFGVNALAVNTAANNTAVGTNALAANTTSANNTAVGFNTLAINTPTGDTGDRNTAVGSGALARLNGGNNNTAVGYNALTNIATTTRFNTAVGSNALSGASGASSINNVAVGDNTITGTGTITQSVAVGSDALRAARDTSTRNTAIGFSAGSTITTGTDNIIIGTGAQTSSAGSVKEIVIGAGTIHTAYVNAASWSFSSDRRLKSDITDSPLGLNFIKTIRPVSYFRKDDLNKKTEYGFIAQELETALNNAGSYNNGILSHTANGMYAVRYNDFLPIAIKAIQEQQDQIEQLQKKNDELTKMNEAILKRLEALENK